MKMKIKINLIKDFIIKETREFNHKLRGKKISLKSANSKQLGLMKQLIKNQDLMHWNVKLKIL